MLKLKTIPAILLVGTLLLSSCAKNEDEAAINALPELTDVASPEQIAEDLQNNPQEEEEEEPTVPEVEPVPEVLPQPEVPEVQLPEPKDESPAVEEPELEEPEMEEPKEEEPAPAPVPERIKILAIYVDKSSQRLTIYENALLDPETGAISTKGIESSLSWKVSTGTEKRRCPPNGKCYVAYTPNGIYTPFRMHKRYRSKLWKAKMDYAVFFNGGIALHATYGKDHLDMLGRKDSGGCVRQSEANAIKTFDLVKKIGMEKTRVIIQD